MADELSAYDKKTLTTLQDEYGVYAALGGASDGKCSQCETYAQHGIHWDSCPNRGKIHMGWCSVEAWKAFRDGWFEEFGEMADFKQMAREKVAKAIEKGAMFQVEIVEGHLSQKKDVADCQFKPVFAEEGHPNDKPKTPKWRREPFHVTRPAIRTNPDYVLHFDPNGNHAFVGMEMAPGSLEEEHAKLRGKVIDLETTVSELAAEIERLKNPSTVKFYVGGPVPPRKYDFRRSIQAEAERQIKNAEDLAWRFADQSALAQAVHRWLVDNGYADGRTSSTSINQRTPWQGKARNPGDPWRTIDIPEADRPLILAEVEKRSK